MLLNSRTIDNRPSIYDLRFTIYGFSWSAAARRRFGWIPLSRRFEWILLSRWERGKGRGTDDTTNPNPNPSPEGKGEIGGGIHPLPQVVLTIYSRLTIHVSFLFPVSGSRFPGTSSAKSMHYMRALSLASVD
jgi:hypothetical protein